MKNIFTRRVVRYFLATLAILCFPWCGSRYCSVTGNETQLASSGAVMKECVLVGGEYRNVDVAITHTPFRARAAFKRSSASAGLSTRQMVYCVSYTMVNSIRSLIEEDV